MVVDVADGGNGVTIGSVVDSSLTDGGIGMVSSKSDFLHVATAT